MSATPIFRFTQQRGKWDCGVACLAMLLRKTYEEVLIAVASSGNLNVLKTGLYSTDIQRIAKDFGIELRRRVKRIDIDEHTGIIGIDLPKGKSHWVYLASGLIFDPEENGDVWDSYMYVKAYKAKVVELFEEEA